MAVACDTCHKVLNVCSFQQDGWAHAAAAGRMTFCVAGGWLGVGGGGGEGEGTCCGSSSSCLSVPVSSEHVNSVDK